MTELQQWFELAKSIGAGGAAVLGVVCYMLWKAYREEVTYSKARDRETLTVLAAMVEADKTAIIVDGHHEDRVLAAINELKQLILQHQK